MTSENGMNIYEIQDNPSCLVIKGVLYLDIDLYSIIKILKVYTIEIRRY